MEAVKSNALNDELNTAPAAEIDPLLIPAWEIIPPPRSIDEFIADPNPIMEESVHELPFILTAVATVLMALGAALNVIFTSLGGIIGELVNVSGMVKSNLGYVLAGQAFVPLAVLLILSAICAFKLMTAKDMIDRPRFEIFTRANKVLFIYGIFKIIDVFAVGLIGFLLPFAKENARIPNLLRWIGFDKMYEMSGLSEKVSEWSVNKALIPALFIGLIALAVIAYAVVSVTTYRSMSSFYNDVSILTEFRNSLVDAKPPRIRMIVLSSLNVVFAVFMIINGLYISAFMLIAESLYFVASMYYMITLRRDIGAPKAN